MAAKMKTQPTQTNKGITKNKGELSELYAFVSILAGGGVDLVDGNLNSINRRLEFLRMYRLSDNNHVEYEIDHKHSNVIIDHGGAQTVVRQRELREKAHDLLDLILKSSGAISQTDNAVKSVLDILHLSAVSAKAQDKSDFRATVRMADVPGFHTLGFSVKSQLGAASTLLNANKLNSAIRYRVVRKDGQPMSDADIFNLLLSNMDKASGYIRRKVANLETLGYELKFDAYRGEALRYNLTMIDAAAPELIALLVAESYRPDAPRTLDQLLVEFCAGPALSQSPDLMKLSSDSSERYEMLEYKLKQVLGCFATGVTVSAKWDGLDNVNGGMIVVTDDGRVLSLQLFTRDALKQYLIARTYFEGPSSSRHPYGEFYEKEDGVFFDLQLQVRFNH